MKMTLKVFKILSLFLIVFFQSCNDWLDVDPKSQVKDKTLLTTEQGFKEALAGVYSAMTKSALYGKEMTFGMIGVLGNEWDYQSSIEYGDEANRYNYETTNNEVRIDALWTGMYNAIANANKILEEIDKKKNVFTGDNYEVIKGEALALRAFLHFDLLRVFGASFEANPDKLSIPFVTKYTKEVFPQLSVRVLIDSVLNDAKQAEIYLQKDPIYTGQEVTINDDNGYLMNRQVHLNYYAVKGLMARIYLYSKDYQNAKLCAQEVIDSKKFEWVKQENLVNTNMADVSFSTEHLFALNIVTLGTIADDYFTSSSGSKVFNLSSSTLGTYYDEVSTDYRSIYQYVANGSTYYLRKFYQLSGANGESWPSEYRNKLPLMKLSEMYYIIAEANYKTSGNVLTYLNEVRINRGITSLNQVEDMELTLLTEFRKEVIGEGQLFFFYKRINRQNILRSEGNIIDMKAYILPMPKDEFNHPGRVDNR